MVYIAAGQDRIESCAVVGVSIRFWRDRPRMDYTCLQRVQAVRVWATWLVAEASASAPSFLATVFFGTGPFGLEAVAIIEM